MSARFVVERHGGASTHRWREVMDTADELRARWCYATLAEALRQGGVRLIRVEGDGAGERTELSRTSAPRLRSRW